METNICAIILLGLLNVAFALPNPPPPDQWLLVLNQDTTSGGYFASDIGKTGMQNKDNPQSNAFSIIGGLDKDDFLFNGKYTLRMVYGGLSDGSSFDKTWTQTSWLMDSTIIGSSLGPYDAKNPNKFYGLGLSHHGLLDGNAKRSMNWWYAAGTTKDMDNGGILVRKNGKTSVIAKSVQVFVCTSEDCSNDAAMAECPMDGNNALSCPMPYNYPSCANSPYNCIDDDGKFRTGVMYRMPAGECYKGLTNLHSSSKDSCSVVVLSTQQKGASDGMYFHFDKTALDKVLGRNNWSDERFTLSNGKKIAVWRYQNGAHGRYDPVKSAKGGDWSIGDKITVDAADCHFKESCYVFFQ